MCRCTKHVRKICLKCRKVFGVCKYRSETAFYCSRGCGRDVRIKNLRPRFPKNQVIETCLNCKSNFTVRKYRMNEAKYCSRKCQGIHASVIHVGKDSPSWKGGITPIKKGFRERLAYRNWRTGVFERDNYTCQFCGMENTRLNAHHIESFNKLFRNNDFESILNLNNGVTLCEPCHKTTFNYGAKSIIPN